jgi:hypothetical protein
MTFLRFMLIYSTINDCQNYCKQGHTPYSPLKRGNSCRFIKDDYWIIKRENSPLKRESLTTGKQRCVIL